MLTALRLGVSFARTEPVTVDLRDKEGDGARRFGTCETQQTGYREGFVFVLFLSCFDHRK